MIKMKKIYLYPKVFPSENPYISDLESALSANFRIVNRNTNVNGVLDLFRFLVKADIFYFNWIESLPSKRFGRVQIIVFVLFMFLNKLMGKINIWTLHNKYAHDKKDDPWVDFMYRFITHRSHLIITHSQEGVEFMRNNYPEAVKKTIYFIHPVKEPFAQRNDRIISWDFLIWGTIWPYKGVIEFLQFLAETDRIENYKILIAGRCINDEVRKDLNSYLYTGNITYRDGFIEMEELADMANRSKFTLFTYRSESILSSGSLMDSIRMGSVIIGPDVGAFRDLSSYSFIITYSSFDEIPGIYNSFSGDTGKILDEINDFCIDNSWDSFGERLNKTISECFSL